MFSAHLGQYAPRPARSVPIVLRSSPEDDQESMVQRFRKLFPAECKAITIPVKNIHRWFDPYDLNRHGAEFLRSVLTTIAKENSLRAQKIAKFAEDWRRNNPTLFNALTSQSQDIFTVSEVKEHDSEFLAEVYQKIILLRSKIAVQYGSSRTPEVSDKRRVVSYPLRSEGSFANDPSQQTRCNSLGKNSRGTSYVTSYPGPPPHPDDTKVYFRPNTKAKAHVKHTPNSNLNRCHPGSQQQREVFNYDAEFYSPQYSKHDTSRPFEIGPFPTFQIPTQHQNMPDIARFAEAAQLSHPTKIPSFNDARLLEREEANNRARAANETIGIPFLPQVPWQDSMQAYYEQIDIQPSASFHQQLTASVKDDPAVVFARDRSGNSIYNDHSTQGQYQRRSQEELEYYHREPYQAQMQPRHLSISLNPLEANKLTPLGANAHFPAGQNQSSQTFQDTSPQSPRQSSYPASQHAQSSSAHLTNHNHEQLPFSSNSTRSDERGHCGYSGEYRKYDDEKLFLSGIPLDTSENRIRELFVESGAHIRSISETKVSARPPHFSPYAFVFVTFTGADEAANAKEALTSNPPTINGRRLIVNYAFVKSPRDLTSQGVPTVEGMIPHGRTNHSRKKAASSASVRPNQTQLTETGAATKAIDPTITMNEKRSPQKVRISSAQPGLTQKTSAQQKRDVKSYSGKRRSGTGSLDAGRSRIEALHNQQKPAQGSKEFPPLAAVQPEASPSKPSIPNPVSANSTLSQLQTSSAQKQVQATENGPLVSKSDNDRGPACPALPKDRLESTNRDRTSTTQPFKPPQIAELVSSAAQLHQAEPHALGADILKLGVIQAEIPIGGTEKAPKSGVLADYGHKAQAQPLEILVQPTAGDAFTKQKDIDESSPSLEACSVVLDKQTTDANNSAKASVRKSGDLAVQTSAIAPTGVQLASCNIDRSGGGKPETALARKSGEAEVKSFGAVSRNKTKPEGKKQANTSAKQTAGTGSKIPIAQTQDAPSTVKNKSTAEGNESGTIQGIRVEAPESKASALVVEITAKAEVGNAESTSIKRTRDSEAKASLPSASAAPTPIETSAKSDVKKQDLTSANRSKDLVTKAATSSTGYTSPANGKAMNSELKIPHTSSAEQSEESERNLSATSPVDFTFAVQNNIKPKSRSHSSPLATVSRDLKIQSSPNITLDTPSAVNPIKLDGKYPDNLTGRQMQVSQDKKFPEPASTHAVKTLEPIIVTQVPPSADVAVGLEGKDLSAKPNTIGSAEVSKEPQRVASPRLASIDLDEPRTPKRVRPQIPPRTSSLLGSPPAPILTHKKKQRVFTPVKEVFGESLPQKPKDGGFESLNRFSLLEPESKEKVETLVGGSYSHNHMDTAVILDVDTPPLGEENQTGAQRNGSEALSTVEAAEPPPNEVNQRGEQRDDPKGRSVSAASQRKKSKHKNTAKKGKGKSKENQASVTAVTIVDRTDEVKSRKPNANLPAPETPYLVDDQYILPRIQPPLIQSSQHKTSSPKNIQKTESAETRTLDSLKHLLHPLSDYPGPETGKSWPPIARPILFPGPSSSSDRRFPGSHGANLRRNSVASTETLEGNEGNQASEMHSQDQYSSSEPLSELATATTPPSSGTVQSSSTVEISSPKNAVLESGKKNSVTPSSPRVRKDSSVMMQFIPNSDSATRGKSLELTGPQLGNPIVDLTGETSPPTTPTSVNQKELKRRISTNASMNIGEAGSDIEPEAYPGNIMLGSPKSLPRKPEKSLLDMLSKQSQSRTNTLEETALWTTATTIANAADSVSDADGYDLAINEDREHKKTLRTKDYEGDILKSLGDVKVTDPVTGAVDRGLVSGVEPEAYPGNIVLRSTKSPLTATDNILHDVLSASNAGRASTTEERSPVACSDTAVMTAKAAEFGIDADENEAATIKSVEHKNFGSSILQNYKGVETGQATEGQIRGSKITLGRKETRERRSQDDPWSVPQGEKAWKSKSTSPRNKRL